MDYEKKKRLMKLKNAMISYGYTDGAEELESIFSELKESEDEGIRKELANFLQSPFIKENLTDEKVAPWLAYLEKQKDSDKAMSAIEKIDKYIDAHTANVHDMDDSNPDKKYYSGVDGTLSDIAGILIDVYSEGKQKSNIEKLREISTPADEDWFEIEKKWEAEDNEDLRSFISVKFASNAKVIDGKRFAVFTWERFKDAALELINRGEKQKPKWSEEDENAIIAAIRACRYMTENFENSTKQYEDAIERLKSLCPHPKQEWSEEDGRMLNACVNVLYAAGHKTLSNWLEKHKEYVNDLSLEQEAYLTSERFKQAEKEKDEFTTRQFLQCLVSFDKFREGEHYWLEYIGGDKYVGRSDNVLGEVFHITPRQLFTLFSQKLEEAQEPPQEEKQASLNCEPPFDENPSDKEIIEALIKHLKEQDGFLTAIDCISARAILNWLKKQKEQKPAACIDFDNEFENQISRLLVSVLNGEHEYNEGLVKYAAQSLLGYAKQEQKPAEWSEDDEIRRESCISYLANTRDMIEFNQYIGDNARKSGKKEIQKDIDWLKSLPERFNLQPKQEWSEEDYNAILIAIDWLQYYRDTFVVTGETKDEISDCVDRLKSLRPQPHWKPSEEQLKALILARPFVVDDFGENPTLSETLESLYNDLKKL